MFPLGIQFLFQLLTEEFVLFFLLLFEGGLLVDQAFPEAFYIFLPGSIGTFHFLTNTLFRAVGQDGFHVKGMTAIRTGNFTFTHVLSLLEDYRLRALRQRSIKGVKIRILEVEQGLLNKWYIDVVSSYGISDNQAS